MPEVVDIVPAARTVLLELDGPGRQDAVRRRLDTMRVTVNAEQTAPGSPWVKAITIRRLSPPAPRWPLKSRIRVGLRSLRELLG